MKNPKLSFLLFICIAFCNYTFCQTEPEIISTCVDTISGIKHGHILSILDCDASIEITSTIEESNTIISGVIISSEPISITPGENGARIVPTNHSENDPSIQDRTHTATHLKVRPPTGGRFMKFKEEQVKLIYPNPANDKITINTKEKLRSITVYNLYGTTVIKKEILKVNADKTILNIEELKKGFYIVKVLFVNGITKTETLIKH